MDLIKVAEQAFAGGKAAEFPEFKAGDTITVTYRIKEGDKERDQKFRGVVIQMKGVRVFRPNRRTHPAFADALAHARDAGVQVLARDCLVTPDSLTLDQPVAVEL